MTGRISQLPAKLLFGSNLENRHISPSHAQQLRARLLCRADSTSERPKLKDFERTLLWARKSFEEHVAQGRPEDQIQLAWSSLLIAMEDAAAAEVHHANSPPLMEQWLIQHIHRKGTQSERDWVKKSHIAEAPVLWDLGSASTWNLERLEALAMEVQAHLRQSCSSDEACLATFGEMPGDEASDCSEDRTSDASAAQEQLSSEAREQAFKLAAKHPMLAISAINEVLFEHQGYQGRPNYGDVRGLQLPHVMERGDGSSAVLTILYVEICERIGLPMDPILCDGSYGLLRHRSRALQLGSDEVVVDVYSKGALFLLQEVVEVFELPEEVPMASKRDLLCALLGDLRDLHWAKAVRCRTEPKLMTPISIETVLSGDVSLLHGYQIQRSVAAAERACKVCPTVEEKVKLAVLLYFGGQYSRALDIMDRLGSQEHAAKSFELKLQFLTK